jgi:transposase
VRSDHHACQCPTTQEIPGKTSPHPFLRRRREQASRLSNEQLHPAPATIAELYRSRWQVELFFKWIKQHLRIKAFYGTSQNAVKTQVWIAISVYLIVAIAKKRLNLDASLYTILQIISVTIFEKTPLLQALEAGNYMNINDDPCKQLTLFD